MYNANERVLDYFRREKVYKRLDTIVSFLLKERGKIKFNLKVGGDSFTDGETITVGVPKLFLTRSKAEIFSVLKALVAHEASHIIDSDFTVMRDYLSESTEYLTKNYKISVDSANKIAHHIFNSVEDGRIERRLVNRLKGCKKHIQFLNLSFWNESKVTGNELNDFLFTITSLSVVGLKTKGFDEEYKCTKAFDEIEKIKGLIDRGIKQSTCKGCSDICMNILETIAPYISTLIDDDVDLNKLNSNTEYTTDSSSNKAVGDDISSHIDISNNNNNSSKNRSGKSDENNKDERQSDDDCGIDENLIKEKINQIEQEVIEEGSPIIENINKSDEIELKRKEKQESAENACDVGIEDITAINRSADYRVEYSQFTLPKDNFERLEGDNLKRSRVLKREIEKILKNRQEHNFRYQRRGSLDTSSIWRVGINQTDVFNKKQIPEVDDYVFYILVDGSGSMSGAKMVEAMNSCAILEESIKEFFPFKIAIFSGRNERVKHIKVKGFTDKPQKYNLSISSLKYNLANDTNNDGYSIRIATNELLKRPEKNKILIVLSDGLPSASSFGHRNITDVKIAVKEARKKGIEVFSIFFGTEAQRNKESEVYRYMYEKNIISSRIEEINKNLIKLFRRTFFNN